MTPAAAIRRPLTLLWEWATVCALFTALGLAYTYPLWLHAGTYVHDLGDPLHDVVTAWWLSPHFLSGHFTGLFDVPPMFFPERLPLTYADPQFGDTLIGLPVYLLTHSAVASYNFVVLISVPLCALGAYALARHLTESRAGGLVAGIIWGFGLWHNGQVAHQQLLSLEFLPFLLLMLHRYAETGRGRYLVGLFACWIAQEYTCLYWGQFLLMLIAPFAAFVLRSGHRLSWRRTLITMGVIGLALAAWAPLLWPYVSVSHQRHHTLGEVEAFSANLADYAPFAGTWLWGQFGSAADSERGFGGEFEVSTGLIALLLACAACVHVLDLKRKPRVENARAMRRRRLHQRIAEWFAVVMCLLFGLDSVLGLRDLGMFGLVGEWLDQPTLLELALVGIVVAVCVRYRVPERYFRLRGPVTPWLCYAPLALVAMIWSCGLEVDLYGNKIAPGIHTVIAALPGHGGIRCICRIGVIADLAIAVLAAQSVRLATARFRLSKLRYGVILPALLCLCLLIVAESAPRAGLDFRNMSVVPPAARPVDIWLERQPRAPAIELPLTVDGATETMRFWHQTVHKMPLRNGYGSYAAPGYVRDVQVLQTPDSPEAVTDLRKLGIRYVILETDNQNAGVATYVGAIPRMPQTLGKGYDLLYKDPVVKVYGLDPEESPGSAIHHPAGTGRPPVSF